MLTLEKLQKMEPGEIIAKGYALNQPNDVYLTDAYPGRRLRWIAVRGRIADWAIYANWDNVPDEDILTNGDKMSLMFLNRFLEASPEAIKAYRR